MSMPAIRLTLALAAVAALGGCVTSTVQEVREGHTELAEGDAVVVLGRRNRPSSSETELDFVTCVSRNMGNGSNGIPVVDGEAFRDALFPWFEPRTAPMNASDLPELISHPALVDRFESVGVKYVVWVEGSTRRTDSAGSLSCSVTPGGAGCFGFLTWENDSDYEASVWDIESGRTVGRVSSEAVGTSYMPAVVVPVPIIARVKSSACSSLANQLKGFLGNSS